jgi:hypothetical protein
LLHAYQHIHRGFVCRNHLHGQHRLDFIRWPDTINCRERRVEFGLRWKRGTLGPYDDSETSHRSIGEGRRFSSERIQQASGESSSVRMRRSYVQRPIFQRRFLFCDRARRRWLRLGRLPGGEHGPAALHLLCGGGLEGVPSVASLSPQTKKIATEDIRYVDGVRDVCYLCSDTAEFGAK